MSWNWQLVNIMATWAAALGASACAISIARLIRFQRQIHKQTMTALNEMSDTYKQAWAIVCEDLNQLRERIAELENR